METAVTIETIYQVLTELKQILEEDTNNSEQTGYLEEIMDACDNIQDCLTYEYEEVENGVSFVRTMPYLEKIDNSLQDINLTLKYGFAFALVIAVIAMLVKTFFTGW